MQQFSNLVKLLLESNQQPIEVIGHNGDKRWVWKQGGVLHRTDGPAVVYENGREEWYKNGKLHRDDGPAITHTDSVNKSWYQNDKLHRDGGPAIDWSNCKAWFIHGKKHREDGPAFISTDGKDIQYYINDKFLTEDEFNNYVKQKKLNKELSSNNNHVFNKDFLDEL